MDQQERKRLGRLADPARVHTQLARDSKEARDAAIYDSYESGAGLREISEATGLSISHCHRIVMAETTRRQVVTVEESA